MQKIDIETLALRPFPTSPLPPHRLLIPLESLEAVFDESVEMQIEFERIWIEHICEGVAYLFSWRGEPRATVLVVMDGNEITHVEVQSRGGSRIEGDGFRPIASVLEELCHRAGFRLWQRDGVTTH